MAVTFTLHHDDGTPWSLREMDDGRIMVSGPTFNYQRVVAELRDVVTRGVEVQQGEAKVKSSMRSGGSFDETVSGKPDAVASVRLTNQSGRDVTIARRPGGVHMSWPGGVSSHGGGFGEEELIETDFVSLKLGGSMTFDVTLEGDFLLAEPATRKLTLLYRSNGRSLGLKSWIGSLKVEFGSEWKEERKIEKVEKTWPNGNLKVIGQTVNGHKYGEWHYFNEDGDRVKIIHYTGNRGSATTNPEHPNNKGAGIKKQ